MSDTRIAFFAQPYRDTENLHVVEKDISGVKRRYLKGIASGIKLDGHQERLTMKAIESMQEQAKSGDILLYADRHGIAMTDDIGRLVSSDITPDGDWLTEWRLYDVGDNIGANTLERVNKLWKQLNGLPPYTKKAQRGFSIEGYIPDDGIINMSEDGRRVIDNVILDGSVVVPRPAYKTSIASAVYKALGENPPWIVAKQLKDSIRSRISGQETAGNYYRRRGQIDDALDDQIEQIMSDGETVDKRERLEYLLDEYKGMIIDLVLSSGSVWVDFESNADTAEEVLGLYKSNNKTMLLKSLIDTMTKIEERLQQTN